MTYNEQDMTWEDLKRPKMACNEQGTNRKQPETI